MTNLLEDTNDQPSIDPNKNYLEELVGEGKKFKTPEDLARGKYEADTHITNLERRFDELRADYLKVRDENVSGAKLQELIDKLEQAQQLTNRESPQNSNEDKLPPYDPKEVESLVSSQIQRHEQTKQQEANYNLVQGKLSEVLGANYKNVLKEQANTLGLTDEAVNAMARSNPKLFFKTFDLDNQKQTENFQTPPNSSRRSDSFAPRTEKRTWAYYQELRKKDPKAWLDKKIAVQMDKDAQALGKEFYDV